MESGGNLCYVCEKPASTKCSKCKVIYYCSVDCQRKDWKNHKPQCGQTWKLEPEDPTKQQFDYDATSDKNQWVTFKPKKDHKFTLIFMHGLGDTAMGFFPMFASQGGNRLTPLNCKIILPTAPKCAVTCNGGAKTTSWFDFYKLDFGEMVDPTYQKVWSHIHQYDINLAADNLIRIIDEEAKLLGDDPSRIFIGGFSQGAMVSIAAFLKYKGQKRLGGVIGLSGMQGLNYSAHVTFENDEEKERIANMRKETPMFIYHGLDDQVLPFKTSEVTYSYLQKEVYAGTHNLVYETESGLVHSLSQKEDQLLRMWMQQHIREKE